MLHWSATTLQSHWKEEKKFRLALEAAALQTSTVTPLLTQLEEIQLLTAQMQPGTTESALELIYN